MLLFEKSFTFNAQGKDILDVVIFSRIKILQLSCSDLFNVDLLKFSLLLFLLKSSNIVKKYLKLTADSILHLLYSTY